LTKQIYIGNLPFETKEEEVRRLCSPYGAVKSVAMIRDRDSGRFRGFCFVEMEDSAAAAAISALNGKEVAGRKIKVNKAHPRKQGRGGRNKKNNQKRGKQQERPLHERTNRGGFGGSEQYPHSGGSRGRQMRGGRDQGRGNSDFPHSGGSSRS
jgi:RNA recognition motif-containing protein